MQFINEPVSRSLEDYQASIERIVSQVNQCDEIVAIYQVGGLSAPGISDIDLVIVVEDGVKIPHDPLAGISKEDTYFFVHNLFGVSRSQFLSLQETSLFHNYNWIDGSQLDWEQGGLTDHDRETLKRQVAFEYLLRMLVNITLDKTYRVFNVRNLLLQSHAIKYDLEFLKVSGGKLFDLVQQVIQWRKCWFESRPNNRELETWFDQLATEIEKELANQLQINDLYLKSGGPFRMGKNITIRNANSLTVSHHGFRLPSILARWFKKYSRLQNRLNRFEFEIPFSFEDPPKILAKVFQINDELNTYNREHLPHFMPLSSSLSLSEVTT